MAGRVEFWCRKANQMAIEVSVAASGKYLVSRVTGEINTEIAIELGRQTEKVAQETGISDRLIDVRGTPNTQSVVHNYDFAYKDLEEIVDRGTKAAALVSPGDDSHDFIMIAIRNAGFNGRKFTDEAAAIAWLEADDV
jgi:hypothetical protein